MTFSLFQLHHRSFVASKMRQLITVEKLAVEFIGF